jgi:hypothetical protein
LSGSLFLQHLVIASLPLLLLLLLLSLLQALRADP